MWLFCKATIGARVEQEPTPFVKDPELRERGTGTGAEKHAHQKSLSPPGKLTVYDPSLVHTFPMTISCSVSMVVKTVKEQTFRHLTGMKPKRLSSFLNLPHRKRFGRENRFWTKSKQSVLNQTNSGTILKRFGFVSKTISERLSFRFWHY